MPGYGDLGNYELLIEAGFTPPVAVQIIDDDRLGTRSICP